MDSINKYKAIGLMSGTSLDGVDIAYCILRLYESGWAHAIETVQTVNYSAIWKRKLSEAHLLKGEDLQQLHAEYGKYLGLLVEAFLIKNKLRGINFIASHGHTVFHQPDKNFTFQLGDGFSLHAATGLPVVCDFRSLDVKLGGQGAPLVPIGDKLLFSEYDVCLNLGGIANLSYDVGSRRTAFDVCFANMGLNVLAATLNVPYDKNGKLASEGDVNEKLLNDLNKKYSKIKKARPSLGREIFEQQFLPVLMDAKIPVNDKLRTLTESIALEIVDALPEPKKKLTVLCTGGGAFNSFLMYRLIELGGDDYVFVRPEDDTVKFKEALVFAFLGALRVRGEINTLKSVTGAAKDSCGGIMIGF